MKPATRCRDCNIEISRQATRCRDCYMQPTARPKVEAWDGVDEIAVERLIRGEPCKTTYAERVRAAQRMTGYGLTAQQIAWRMGTSTRAVVRMRAVDNRSTATGRA